MHFLKNSLWKVSASSVSLNKLLPFYAWLLIFSLQPHKEERFMFLAYPSLCFSAAVGLDTLLFMFQSILLYFKPLRVIISLIVEIRLFSDRLSKTLGFCYLYIPWNLPNSRFIYFLQRTHENIHAFTQKRSFCNICNRCLRNDIPKKSWFTKIWK